MIDTPNKTIIHKEVEEALHELESSGQFAVVKGEANEFSYVFVITKRRKDETKTIQAGS